MNHEAHEDHEGLIRKTLRVLRALRGWLLFGVLAGAPVTACSSGPAPPTDASYGQGILQSRATKDASFRTGSDSPIPAAARATFAGLAYYPVDAAYRVPSYLTEDRAAPRVVIQMETSLHQLRHMRKVGTLGFTLAGSTHSLTAFADIDARDVNRLFVPFGDLTSGTETYGGGRYLELDRTPTGLYDLDFNRAYHPYCLYSPTFDCPVPPRENRLAVMIRAGERMR